MKYVDKALPLLSTTLAAPCITQLFRVLDCTWVDGHFTLDADPSVVCFQGEHAGEGSAAVPLLGCFSKHPAPLPVPPLHLPLQLCLSVVLRLPRLP